MADAEANFPHCFFLLEFSILLMFWLPGFLFKISQFKVKECTYRLNDIKVSPNHLVCKVVGITTESGKFLFVQSGIPKSLASIARNLGLWNP